MGSKLFTYIRKRADQSFHRLTPSVYVIPSVYVYPVSFRMSSFTCGVIFLHIPVSLEGMLTAKTPRHLCPAYAVTLVYLILSSSLAPYSIPPSDFVLTGCGVCFLKRQGYRSRGSMHLMPWTGGSFLLAQLLTRRRFVFRALFSHI